MEDDGAGDDESGNAPEPVGVVEGAVPEGLADVEARDVTVYGVGTRVDGTACGASRTVRSPADFSLR